MTSAVPQLPAHRRRDAWAALLDSAAPTRPSPRRRGERRADARDHDGTVDDGCRRAQSNPKQHANSHCRTQARAEPFNHRPMTTIGKGVFLIGTKARRNAVDEHRRISPHSAPMRPPWADVGSGDLLEHWLTFSIQEKRQLLQAFRPGRRQARSEQPQQDARCSNREAPSSSWEGGCPLAAQPPWRCTLKERSATLSRRATLPCEQVPELLRE